MSDKKTNTKNPISTKKLEITNKINWLPKKTFELEITIPRDLVKTSYDKVLENTAKTIEIKGFRKGKAPKNLVEKQVGKAALFEKTVQTLVTDAYVETVRKNNLRPIINPQITPISLEENKDWIVKATSCEIPEVKLGKYEDSIKGLKAKSAIWTPDKGSEKANPSADGPTSQKPTSQQIFEELLKTCEVEIPDMLLDDEVNRLLTSLIDQVQAVGLTIDQYLQNKGQTKESIRKEYRDSAEKSLKIEFIIAQISMDKKIEVSNEEVKKLIESTKEPNAKKTLENPQQLAYLKTILRKQKTIDYLTSL